MQSRSLAKVHGTITLSVGPSELPEGFSLALLQNNGNQGLVHHPRFGSASADHHYFLQKAFDRIAVPNPEVRQQVLAQPVNLVVEYPRKQVINVSDLVVFMDKVVDQQGPIQLTQQVLVQSIRMAHAHNSVRKLLSFDSLCSLIYRPELVYGPKFSKISLRDDIEHIVVTIRVVGSAGDDVGDVRFLSLESERCIWVLRLLTERKKVFTSVLRQTLRITLFLSLFWRVALLLRRNRWRLSRRRVLDSGEVLLFRNSGIR